MSALQQDALESLEVERSRGGFGAGSVPAGSSSRRLTLVDL